MVHAKMHLNPLMPLSMKSLQKVLLIGCLLMPWHGWIWAQVSPLSRAHAHNDYEHERPLKDALDAGFCSVEADVFAVDGALWVAHDRIHLDSKRTLTSLYLDPLQKLIQQQGGAVYDEKTAFYLMIDFKSGGASTYEICQQVIQPYRSILSHVNAEGFHQGPVTIVISGNRPIDLIEHQTERWVFVDGRLSDMKSNQKPSSLIPWVSENWKNHFSWDGTGVMPEAEVKALRRWIDQAHDQGRKVRFWATPETETFWRTAYQAGLDFLNTDQLLAMRQVLLSLPSP